jgi:hypothetical protein
MRSTTMTLQVITADIKRPISLGNVNPKTLTMKEDFVDSISGYHCQI